MKNLVKIVEICLYYNSDERLSANELLELLPLIKYKGVQDIENKYQFMIQRRVSKRRIMNAEELNFKTQNKSKGRIGTENKLALIKRLSSNSVNPGKLEEKNVNFIEDNKMLKDGIQANRENDKDKNIIKYNLHNTIVQFAKKLLLEKKKLKTSAKNY